MPSGGGGAGSGRRRLPPAWAPVARRLLPPPEPAPARPRIAPGPASDSAPPPPVPSSPGRSPGPLPRHEEAVGEEAFPGEGSGGGRRREGAGRDGSPGGRAGHHGWARGRGLWSRARLTRAAVAASRAPCGGLPICDLRAQIPPTSPRAEGQTLPISRSSPDHPGRSLRSLRRGVYTGFLTTWLHFLSPLANPGPGPRLAFLSSPPWSLPSSGAPESQAQGSSPSSINSPSPALSSAYPGLLLECLRFWPFGGSCPLPPSPSPPA